MDDNTKTAKEIVEMEKLSKWMDRREVYRRALAKDPNAGGLYIDKDGRIGWGTYPSE